MTFTLIDFFCGAGGSSQGAVAVPGVSARLAANHWSRAIESHAANFPHTEHYQGDLHAADLAGFPAGDIFWASPECPQWSVARGRRREFDKQPDLFGEVLGDEAADRSRALMWDVPRYLEAMKLRGRPVLAGVVENVTDVRAWAHWPAWVASIRNLGYRTRLIALNSMHARPAATPPAPQSRDRLYLAYLDNFGRYMSHSGRFQASRSLSSFADPGRVVGLARPRDGGLRLDGSDEAVMTRSAYAVCRFEPPPPSVPPTVKPAVISVSHGKAMPGRIRARERRDSDVRAHRRACRRVFRAR